MRNMCSYVARASGSWAEYTPEDDARFFQTIHRMLQDTHDRDQGPAPPTSRTNVWKRGCSVQRIRPEAQAKVDTRPKLEAKRSGGHDPPASRKHTSSIAPAEKKNSKGCRKRCRHKHRNKKAKKEK